jgi:hypothetical protein
VKTKSARIEDRVESVDWSAHSAELDQYGASVLKGLLSPEECKDITEMYNSSDGYS